MDERLLEDEAGGKGGGRVGGGERDMRGGGSGKRKGSTPPFKTFLFRLAGHGPRPP